MVSISQISREIVLQLHRDIFWKAMSLDAGHSPDVASLRSEAVEQHPRPVRRPYRVVNSDFRVGKFVDLFRLPAFDRRHPEDPVAYNVHNPGAVRRKRNVRAPHHFSKRLRVASIDRHLHGRRFPPAYAPEYHLSSFPRPPPELPAS